MQINSLKNHHCGGILYVFQEKFIDYWTDDPPGNNSRVISVKINSVTVSLAITIIKLNLNYNIHHVYIL